MRPQAYTVTIQLTVQADERISRADIINDLRKQVPGLKEQQPRRLADGAGWWAIGADVTFANAGDQLAAEAEPDYIPPSHLDLAGDMLADHLARAHDTEFLASEDPQRLIACHREQHAR
jgi:hypothetical protein